MQFFLEGQQSDAFCAWQLSQCGWMENGRRASGANAPIVATNLLWWRETAPPWSQKDRIHRVHHFTFASDAVSVFTCVHFPAGSEFCSCSFHLMSLDSKSLHFTSFAFRLALTFCDLALLLRPSLLYQRSVKRSWLWPQGGTIAQDLTMQWSTLSGFMQDLSLLVIDEGQQYGTDREIAVISLLNFKATTPGAVDRGLAANARRHCPGGAQCQKVSPAPVGQKTRATQRQELLYAIQPSRSNDQALRQLL